jgi:3'(2'), 5'-bisphosphate nucleotidase
MSPELTRRIETGLLETAIRAACLGGKAILEVYSTDFTVEHKEDKTPLTLADRNAHKIITRLLKKTGLPVLSEEGKDIPYEERKIWKDFWLVDPLDGTKEFIKRNGEFTVNIALISEAKPILGVIYVPVNNLLYFASRSAGAFKTLEFNGTFESLERLIENSSLLPVSDHADDVTVVCSRSHMSDETLQFVNKLKKNNPGLGFTSVGSSLKLCLVAEGSATIYPRFGPTMEWDTAAGHAILEISGGRVTYTDSPDYLSYNKRSLLNPSFIAWRKGFHI